MSFMDIDIKYKDYEWRKYDAIVSSNPDSYPLYEFIRWEEYNGKKSCYVIVFITYNKKDWHWEINDNMSRWLELPEEDIIEITKISKSVLDMLNSVKGDED